MTNNGIFNSKNKIGVNNLKEKVSEIISNSHSTLFCINQVTRLCTILLGNHYNQKNKRKIYTTHPSRLVL